MAYLNSAVDDSPPSLLDPGQLHIVFRLVVDRHVHGLPLPAHDTPEDVTSQHDQSTTRSWNDRRVVRSHAWGRRRNGLKDDSKRNPTRFNNGQKKMRERERERSISPCSRLIGLINASEEKTTTTKQNKRYTGHPFSRHSQPPLPLPTPTENDNNVRVTKTHQHHSSGYRCRRSLT